MPEDTTAAIYHLKVAESPYASDAAHNAHQAAKYVGRAADELKGDRELSRLAKKFEDVAKDAATVAGAVRKHANKLEKTMKTSNLRRRLIRLAHDNPDLRPKLLPLLKGSQDKTAGDPEIRWMMEAVRSLKQGIQDHGPLEGEMTQEWMADATIEIARGALERGDADDRWKKVLALAQGIKRTVG